MGQQEFISYRTKSISPKIDNRFTSRSIVIDNQKNLIEEKFPLIKKWKAGYLGIHTCALPHLFKYIKDIEFVCLA